VAEKSGAVLASHTFGRENHGALAGVRIAVGADYPSSRPGDAAIGRTAAGVLIQPSFYLSARTSVNLTVAYHDYLMTGVTRYMVFPSAPRNTRICVKYGF
jgi:hypothetical protein